ncbi:U1 snRNP-associated protein Usp107 [Schizosaccharomyces japonicus yFS275]|uniref:U1 snRNP-associated protein Usp107 n=1 Tax=Schizosaccharomyces japonicus (strain yFS275 / FY16936) TaxID=402676 RepID=B6K634_SCHJY|nr:U1 snRNP-associated protein Usp107 [Schizosaccharomyces japonicus yFS275]EEB08988.2 U1 snRNP-associated protein Usp107 [Schizosaccharomyces japonicus yFS275]
MSYPNQQAATYPYGYVQNAAPLAVPFQPVVASLPSDYKLSYPKLYPIQNALIPQQNNDPLSTVDLSAPVIRFQDLVSSKQTKDTTFNTNEANKNVSKTSKSENAFVQQGREQNHPAATQKEVRPLLNVSTNQMKRMLLISDVPKALDDFWMDKVLRLSGKLIAWRRIVDENDEPTSFGFAEFENTEQFSRALEVLSNYEFKLGGESNPTVEKLTIQVDKANESLIKDWRNNRYYKNKHESAIIQQIYANLDRISLDITNPDIRARIERAAKQAKEKQERALRESKMSTITINAADLEGINPDQLPMIENEIRSFRDRSALKEREKQRAQEEYTRLRREFKERERKAEQELLEPLFKRPVAQKLLQLSSSLQSMLLAEESYPSDLTDEEIANREKEREKAKEEESFYSRERRWFNRERARAAALEREDLREHDEEARRVSQRRHYSEKLATFDDDEEARTSRDEYFVDRAAWIRHRAVARVREEDADEQDRRADERNAQHRDTSANGGAAHEKTITSEMPFHEGPVKLSLQPAQQPAKRDLSEKLMLPEEEEDEEDESVMLSLYEKSTKNKEASTEKEQEGETKTYTGAHCSNSNGSRRIVDITCSLGCCYGGAIDKSIGELCYQKDYRVHWYSRTIAHHIYHRAFEAAQGCRRAYERTRTCTR